MIIKPPEMKNQLIIEEFTDNPLEPNFLDVKIMK